MIESKELAGVSSESLSVRNGAGGLEPNELQDPGTALGRIYKLWQVPTPTRLIYRPWEALSAEEQTARLVAIEAAKPTPRQPVLTEQTPRIPSAEFLRLPKLLHATWRNVGRLMKDKTKDPVVHWAATPGLEPADAKKVRNAMKRQRRVRQ